MKKLFQFIGCIIFLAGISLLIRPTIIYDWVVNHLESPPLYVAAIAGRLILGTLLLIAAKQAKHPKAIRFFGAISIIAALLFLFLGQAEFVKLLSSWLPLMKSYGWVSGLVSIVLGGFLIYTFSYADKKLER